MSVPTSNFRLSSPSAWFLFGDSGVYKRATMNGKTFWTLLQGALKSQLQTPAPTYDGSMVSASAISADGIPGPITYKALWAVLSKNGSDQGVLNAVAIAARVGAVTGASIPAPVVTLAAKTVLNSFGYLPSSVVIPRTAILPQYRVAPAGTATTSFSVTNATAEEIAAAGAPSLASTPSTPAREQVPVTDITPRTTTQDSASTGTSPGTSTGTVPDASTGTPSSPRYLPMDLVTTGTTPLPTGQSGRQVVTGTGLSWGPILVAGGAILVVGLIGWSLLKEPAKSPPRKSVAGKKRR